MAQKPGTKPTLYISRNKQRITLETSERWNKIKDKYYCRIEGELEPVMVPQRNCFETLEEAVFVLCSRLDEKIEVLEDQKKEFKKLLDVKVI